MDFVCFLANNFLFWPCGDSTPWRKLIARFLRHRCQEYGHVRITWLRPKITHESMVVAAASSNKVRFNFQLKQSDLDTAYGSGPRSSHLSFKFLISEHQPDGERLLVSWTRLFHELILRLETVASCQLIQVAHGCLLFGVCHVQLQERGKV